MCCLQIKISPMLASTQDYCKSNYFKYLISNAVFIAHSHSFIVRTVITKMNYFSFTMGLKYFIKNQLASNDGYGHVILQCVGLIARGATLSHFRCVSTYDQFR